MFSPTFVKYFAKCKVMVFLMAILGVGIPCYRSTVDSPYLSICALSILWVTFNKCVCVYVYLYTHIYARMCIYIYTHIYIRAYIYVYDSGAHISRDYYHRLPLFMQLSNSQLQLLGTRHQEKLFGSRRFYLWSLLKTKYFVILNLCFQLELCCPRVPRTWRGNIKKHPGVGSVWGDTLIPLKLCRA